MDKTKRKIYISGSTELHKGLGPNLHIFQIASYKRKDHQKDHIKISKFTKFGCVSLHCEVRFILNQPNPYEAPVRSLEI